ncbi:TIR domain-containing protein [Roseimaritima multifibrata]|nr:TIR domain-containing protein [Roseimaritima multifibrata]
MPVERCLEYTDNNLRDYFFHFGETRIDELLAFPALIAHEQDVSDENVRLVRLTDIARRGNRIRAIFDPTGTELTYEQFTNLSFELDIDGFEYHRTHWAIKNVDLTDVLSKAGVQTPPSAFPQRPYVDLGSHRFQVALSFPGEDRNLVQDIASRLEQRLGLNSVFYDFHYQAFLARPSLDTLLQTVYTNARLNVVFLSGNYERKRWCSGIEFRAIREIIANRENDRVMFIKTGDGDVSGVFATDGWIEADNQKADNIAYFIEQRARVYDT